MAIFKFRLKSNDFILLQRKLLPVCYTNSLLCGKSNRPSPQPPALPSELRLEKNSAGQRSRDDEGCASPRLIRPQECLRDPLIDAISVPSTRSGRLIFTGGCVSTPATIRAPPEEASASPQEQRAQAKPYAGGYGPQSVLHVQVQALVSIRGRPQGGVVPRANRSLFDAPLLTLPLILLHNFVR
jgi:hypothetical protein